MRGVAAVAVAWSYTVAAVAAVVRDPQSYSVSTDDLIADAY